MGRIDTKEWREFRVGDLFDIHPTKAYKLTNSQLLDGGSIPVSANSAYNNGIGGFSTQPPTECGNMVTFSDTVDANTIFYQADPFIGYPHVQGLYPIGEFDKEWSKYSYLFFVSVFRKAALTKGFDYGNKFRRDIAVDLMIKLPTTSENNPDFAYMDAYMRKIMGESEASLENLRQADKSKTAVDTHEWKEFRIDELFYTEKQGQTVQVPTGAMVAKKTLKDGTIPRVTVSNYNNGITGYYKDSNDANYRVYENFISVSFLGTVFYQPKQASLDMKVHCLKPLGIELNEYIAGFLLTVIRKSILNFAYSDQLSSTVLPMLVLKLPATNDGKPDFAYMNAYMRNTIKKSAIYLKILSEALA